MTSERVPISSKPSNLDCRDSGELFDAQIVAVCKIFAKGRGFCRAPCLAVGLLYTCILQGARQAQGPCCTNPNPGAKFWVQGAFEPKFKNLHFCHKTPQYGCLWTRLGPSHQLSGDSEPWGQILGPRGFWTQILKSALLSQNLTIWMSMDSPGP